MWRNRRAFCACAIAVFLLVVSTGATSAQPALRNAISITWDHNTESSVAGYVVHVGTRSGVYTESHDVGRQTLFDYPGAVEGQRYYFAVSAYTVDRVASPLSFEISTTVGNAETPTAWVPGAAAERSQTTASEGAQVDIGKLGCIDLSLTGCRVRAQGLSSVTGIAATDDGRLLVIENGQQLRIISADGSLSVAALLISDARTRLTAVVVDPAFKQTHYVFVGLVGLQDDGSRHFSIVRYREVQNTLGEASVLIASLPLRGSDHAPFALDREGHIYVAMPADPSRADLYAGSLLRFTADGRIPVDQERPSPVWAAGMLLPTLLVWDGSALWMGGHSNAGQEELRRIRVDATPGDVLSPLFQRDVGRSDWNLPAEGIRALGVFRGNLVNGKDEIVLLDSRRDITWIRLNANGTRETRVTSWDEGNMPLTLAAGPGDSVLVAVQSVTGSVSIVEWSRQQ